jgi:uncharacterized membrane protein YeiB/ABC-type multidrug transport system ATPase subunit
LNQRILSLDVIRGFALFGVLAVNAPFFAAPLSSVVNPAYGPLAVSPGTLWSWFGPYVFFEYKSIALFSMLFGASLFLVGGETGDAERSRVVRRRLGWLVLFGILHGILLWFGDILLSYALTGFLLLRLRSWTAAKLLALGLFLFAASMGLLGLLVGMIAKLTPSELADFATQSWAPPPAALAAEIAAHNQGFGAAFAANFSAWVEQQAQVLLILTPRTAGLMLIGMGLLKNGFLTGGADPRTYRIWLVLGGLALAVLAWNGWDIGRQGFPLLRVQAAGTLVTAGLAPVVALGYVAGLILILRSGLLAGLTAALAAVGRMAFTNYIVQSILLSSLFWSGRGLGLYGEMSRPALAGIACLLFALQMAASVLCLRRFGHGPFEWIWRRLSYGAGGPPAGGPDNARLPGGTVGVSAIETRGLAKRFGAVSAVSHVELSVPAGAIYGFLGPNGAGKTTTMRMLLGLMRPDSGEIRIFGRSMITDRRTAARTIGSLLEAGAIYPHLSARDNLDLSRRLLGLDSTEVDRVLELVALRESANRKVGHFSLGMRQRLGLARALLGRPRLLLLDEPMNGLDPDGMADMRRLIRELPGAEGVTIFMSSHLLAEVAQVVTHVGLMRGGRLLAQDRIDSLLGTATPDLFLRTTADGEALALLERSGLAPRVEAGGLVLAGRGGDRAAGEIARLLVDEGLCLHELKPRPVDLEMLYMSWSRKEAA